MSMNFVMTGHKGLIGSFLLERLKKEGHNAVLLIDKRDEKLIQNINEEKLNEKIDLMIHLASFCKINKTIEEPELAFQNNVLGTFRVLEFCRKNGIPKIIFTSSSRVLEEEKNPYTASKIYGEELVKAYCRCYNIDYVIIRPSTVYGPFNDETGRLIDIWIKNAIQGKELAIYGDENKTLDFTYIDDFVQGFILAMNEKNKEYNIAGGKAIPLVHAAELIIKEIGKGSIIFKEKEKEQPQHVLVDISEIDKLGYSPQIDIEEGIRRTADWYSKNLNKS
ncbi:NAD-dependent epimerase/dehydratase family protein [Candidatus Pacearchaeota archaeon]|nr:NAD-dependent epimerase/dehydratase family protein [Candidatus Pacearchaeota archaeon]